MQNAMYKGTDLILIINPKCLIDNIILYLQKNQYLYDFFGDIISKRMFFSLYYFRNLIAFFYFTIIKT